MRHSRASHRSCADFLFGHSQTAKQTLYRSLRISTEEREIFLACPSLYQHGKHVLQMNGRSVVVEALRS